MQAGFVFSLGALILGLLSVTSNSNGKGFKMGIYW